MASVLESDELAAVAHDRTAFNLAVWDKVVANPEFQAMPWRFETDEHGQIIMSPPPAPNHGDKQGEIVRLLGNWNIERQPRGKVIPDCPISTRAGVRAADVAWCSAEVWHQSEGKSCLVRAAEICIEVLSPSNTRAEIDEKIRLYFDAGAQEIWLCSDNGDMTFLTPAGEIPSSALCPGFPAHLS